MDRRFAAITLGLTALIAAAYLGLDAIRIELHFLLSQLNHGVSSGKILFLLGFVAAVMLRFMFCRQAGQASRWPYIVLMAALVLGMGASMAAHLQYVSRYDLPLTTPTFHGRDGYLSVNSTTHIHVGKAAIAHSIDALGLTGLHDRFDTGSVYRSAVPIWLSSIIGLSFLLSSILLVWLAPRAVQGYADGSKQACLLLWALAGCAVSKCILDGGPLAYDAVAGAVCLLLIISGITRARLILAGCLFLCWLGVVYAVQPELVHTQASRAMQRLAIYSLIALIGAWATLSKRPTVRLKISTGLATALVVGLVTMDWMRTVTPLRQTADNQAVIYSNADHETIQARTFQKPGEQSKASLYRQAGEDPLRPRWVSAGRRIPGVDYQLIGEVALLRSRTQRITLGQSEIAQFTQSETDLSYTGPGERMRFIWQINGDLGPVLFGYPNQIAQNERFVSYHLLGRTLQEAGVKEYILTPYLIQTVRRPVDELAHD